MRNPYAPIFRRTLQTRIWSLSPEARCVWLWLRLIADPEGFVNADLAGVAAGANVPREAAKRAMEGFASPDPDADPDDPHGGRVVVRVPGGWQVVDFTDARELAGEENRRSRMRQYMRGYRARGANKPANDSSPTSPPLAPALAQQEQEQEQETRNKEEEEISPLPPSGSLREEVSLMEELREASGAPHWAPAPSVAPPSVPLPPQLVALGEREARMRAFEAPVLPAALHEVPDDWEPDDELRQEALIAGVKDFDARIAKLRLGLIGGPRGIRAHKLRDYIRDQFGRWKAWGEADRAKARAAAAAGKPFKAQHAVEPKRKHINYAKHYGIDIEPLIATIHEDRIVEKLGTDAFHEYLEKALVKARKAKEAA